MTDCNVPILSVLLICPTLKQYVFSSLTREWADQRTYKAAVPRRVSDAKGSQRPEEKRGPAEVTGPRDRPTETEGSTRWFRSYFPSLLLDNDFRIDAGQGLGSQDQEPGDLAEEGATTTTYTNQPLRIPLQTMPRAGAQNLRDGGWLFYILNCSQPSYNTVN